MHDLSKDWSLASNPTSAFPSNVRGTRIRSDSRRAIPRRAGLSCLDFLVRTSSLYAQASECSRPAIDLRNFCSAGRDAVARSPDRPASSPHAWGEDVRTPPYKSRIISIPSPRREKEHNSRAGVLRTPGILPRKHHSTCTTFPKIGASHQTRPLLSRPTSVAHGFEATPVALSHGEPVYRAWISLCALRRSTHRPRSAVGRQSPFAIFAAQDEMQSPARTDLRHLRTHGERTSGHLRTPYHLHEARAGEKEHVQLHSRSPAHSRHPSETQTTAFPSNVLSTGAAHAVGDLVPEISSDISDTSVAQGRISPVHPHGETDSGSTRRVNPASICLPAQGEGTQLPS